MQLRTGARGAHLRLAKEYSTLRDSHNLASLFVMISPRRSKPLTQAVEGPRQPSCLPVHVKEHDVQHNAIA